MSFILPKHIEVLIVSCGGVGTTFLIDFLSKYKKTNSKGDFDGFKHKAVPPISRNPNLKCVYIYGDPVDAVCSLFRRNFQYPQSVKLQKNLLYKANPIPKSMSLETYAKKGKDRFYLEHHFTNWYQRYLFYPTLFIKYESLFDNIEPLLEFLGIPLNEKENFPEKKERSSSKFQLPESTRLQLEEIYSPLIKRLKMTEDVEVRIPKQKPSFCYLVFRSDFALKKFFLRPVLYKISELFYRLINL